MINRYASISVLACWKPENCVLSDKKTLKIFNKNISWWGKVKCFKIFILAVMDINILCKFKILEIIYVSMLRINIKIIEIV